MSCSSSTLGSYVYVNACKRGDPDMEPDELRATIEKVEAKRRELTEVQFAAGDSTKVLSMLPKAAALYRKQIDDGLHGNPEAALKARVILRKCSAKFGYNLRQMEACGPSTE